MSAQHIGRLAVLGLGLIGGSLAAALRKRGLVGEVVGWGRRESSLQQALQLGLIDHYTLDLAEAVSGANLVVVATPTRIAEQVIAGLAGKLEAGAILTDVASVKANVVAAARSSLGDALDRFVPGHPIAGSEQSGAAAARDDLFAAHRVILTPLPETDAAALAKVQAVWAATGAEVVNMPVAEHDAVLAATSHLPHVLAYSLVDVLAQGERGEAVFRFAAGGFRDFTRIASSDPVMWRDIAVANRDALLAALDGFSRNLDQLRGAIERADGAELHTVFERAKNARDRFARQLTAPSTISQE